MSDITEAQPLWIPPSPSGSPFLPRGSALLFSFFAGAGLLDFGFEDEGFVPVLVNESHRPFLDAYIHSRQKMGRPAPAYGYLHGSAASLIKDKWSGWLRNRVTAARATGLPVGFVGGPPCPDFSTAGKQRGKDGEHGRLSQVYVDFVVAQQPDFFVFENVQGLWQRHGEFYRHIQNQLIAAGYLLTERVANALEYGAPQNRGRVIIVGFHNSYLTRFHTVSLHESLARFWQNEVRYSMEQVLAMPWPTKDVFKLKGIRLQPVDIAKELTVQYWFGRNHVVSHPNAVHAFKPQAGLQRMLTVQEGDTSKKSFKRLHRWRYSPTAAYGNNEVHLHPYLARRITVAEALAIQSLPRGFELPPEMTLSDMFKAVGNGVPYLMARGIARSIARFMQEQNRTASASALQQQCTLETEIKVKQPTMG